MTDQDIIKIARQEIDLGFAYVPNESILALVKRFAAHQPQQLAGLTDGEIGDWWRSENGLEDCDMCMFPDFAQVVRAVEAKLREKNGI